MSEQEADAQEATPEAVQSDEGQTPEAAESTEGQVENQPAEGEEGEQPEAPEDEEVSKSKARRERRKAEVQRLREAEREAKAKAQEYETRMQAIKDAAQSQQPPKEADFSDYNDYLIAQAAYQSMAALDKRQMQDVERESEAHRKQVEQIQQQAQEALNEGWAAQVEEAKTRYQDFDAVVTDPRLPITDQMAQVIKASDQGADVAYYLGTHKDEAARIAQMEPLDMARALGAIEARVSLPKPRTTSNAPEPIKPVSPKSGSGSKDPEKMSMREYEAWRMGRA